MKLGFRGRLFAVSVLVVAIGLLLSSTYLERELRGLLRDRVEAELLANARGAAVLIDRGSPNAAPGTPSGPPSIRHLDALADAFGQANGSRITIIEDSGRVLGDSELSPAQIAAVESHKDRPEVVAARTAQSGTAQRYSTTLRTEMLYVAVPLHTEQLSGVVRSARPLSEVERAVSRLWLLLAVAALVALVVATGLSGLASHLMTRALLRLADSARDIAAGRPAPELATMSGEIGAVAGSLSQLADEVDRRIGDLAEERERFEAVLEAMSDGVIALSTDRRITLMNPAAARLLGVDESCIGDSILESVRAPQLQSLVDQPRAGHSAEFEVARPGGPRLRLMATAAPLRGGGSVLVLHDVTEIRRLETMRRDFVANVSHELRTPISIISANAETLAGGAMSDSEHGPKLLSALVRNASRLSNVISDLLDLSRLEAGQREFHPEPIDLGQAADSIIDGLGRPIDNAIPEGLTALADATALDQILANLIQNAVKHTAAEVPIEVDATDEGETVLIEVRDAGPGIPAGLRVRVFERFFRVDPGRSRDKGGTGLGLSIVKHLTEAMGGEVGVRPNPEGGSVFWVRLPRADA